jgi:acyl-coenzyme A thioesterase PaaI-like protein
MAFAAISTARSASQCVTVDASIQYPAPARHAPFTCVTEAPARGNRTVFIRAEVRDAAQTVVALAQGCFRIFDPSGKPSGKPSSKPAGDKTPAVDLPPSP